MGSVEPVEQLIGTDDGVRLWVRDSGGPAGRPAIVCLHGGPGVGDYLGPVEGLVAPYCRVIRFDQRGSGRSDPAGPYTIDRFCADIDVVADAAGLDRFMLLGHSWGANLAIRYAIEAPGRVAGIVHVAGTGLAWWPRYTVVHKQRQAERLGPIAGARLNELRHRTSRSGHEDHELRVLYVRSELHDTDDVSLAEALVAAEESMVVSHEANAALNAQCRATPHGQLIDGCREIECPVLVVHGRSDPRPFEALDSLMAALPSAAVEILDGAGHSPWLERPDVFAAVVRRFVVATD